MNKMLMSVGLAFALAGAGLLPAGAQTPAALTGQVTSGEEGADGGRAGQRQEGRLHCHDHRRQRRAGQLQLSRRQARARAIFLAHSGGRIRSRPAGQRGRGRAAAGEIRPEAAQDRRSRRPALERGMAGKLPRHRPAEERDAGLRGLPHARAGGALDPQARRFHPRHAAAHAGLREPEHSGRTAASARRAADGRARGPARAGLSRHGRLSRRHQSELGPAVELRAQDAAAPERPQHPRGHHRIRPAARDHPAA